MFKFMMKFALLFTLFGTTSVTAFVQPKSLQYTPSSSLHTREPCFKWSSQKQKSTQTSNYYMNKNDDEKETERHDKNAPPTFIDALLEVPDPRLLTGDLLFILIINFLLQIGAEVGSPNEEQRNAAILLGFTQDMWDYPVHRTFFEDFRHTF